MSQPPPHPGRRLGAALRARVTPDDVGARVTIRRWVQDGPRRVHADVLGHLLSWEDGTLLVETRQGEQVEVPEGDVVASRTIPEPPPPRR